MAFLLIKLSEKNHNTQQRLERLTNADHFFNFDAGGVNLLGELADGLVGVLVGERVHVDPHP